MWRWDSGWGARRRGRPSRLLETCLQDRCLARLGPGARRAALFAAAHQLTARSDSIPTGLLPTQARRGKEAPRGDQVPQAQNLRRPLSPTARRPPPRGRCSGWSGSGRALRGVSRIQRGRPTPAHRHFGPATSRTRNADATPGPDDTEDPPRPHPRHRHLTTQGSRKDARARLIANRAEAGTWPPQSSAGGLDWHLEPLADQQWGPRTRAHGEAAGSRGRRALSNTADGQPPPHARPVLALTREGGRLRPETGRRAGGAG